MRTKLAFLFLFGTASVGSCLGTSRICFAQDIPAVHETPVQAAYNRVRSAPYYARGGGGFTGAPTLEEKALQVLVQDKDALTLFEGLLKDDRTTSEGKLYALEGLTRLETEQIKQGVYAIRELKRSQSTSIKQGQNQVHEAAVALDVKARAFAQKLNGYFAAYETSSESTVLVMQGCTVVPHRVSTVAQEIRGFVLYPDPPKPVSPSAARVD